MSIEKNFFPKSFSHDFTRSMNDIHNVPPEFQETFVSPYMKSKLYIYDGGSHERKWCFKIVPEPCIAYALIGPDSINDLQHEFETEFGQEEWIVIVYHHYFVLEVNLSTTIHGALLALKSFEEAFLLRWPPKAPILAEIEYMLNLSSSLGDMLTYGVSEIQRRQVWNAVHDYALLQYTTKVEDSDAFLSIYDNCQKGYVEHRCFIVESQNMSIVDLVNNDLGLFLDLSLNLELQPGMLLEKRAINTFFVSGQHPFDVDFVNSQRLRFVGRKKARERWYRLQPFVRLLQRYYKRWADIYAEVTLRPNNQGFVAAKLDWDSRQHELEKLGSLSLEKNSMEVNALVVSFKRKMLFNIEPFYEGETIPTTPHSKLELMMVALISTNSCDCRDHVFLSPCEKQCCTIPGEVIKRFRREIANKDTPWYICFDRNLATDEVGLAYKPIETSNDNEFIWKQSAESLTSSISPVEILQDRTHDITQQFMVRDRTVETCVRDSKTGLLLPKEE